MRAAVIVIALGLLSSSAALANWAKGDNAEVLWKGKK